MNLPSSSGVEAPLTQRVVAEHRPLLSKVAMGLALLTFIVFYPVLKYEWVNYDDDVFVTNNLNVAPGFTWEGIKWAFTSADIDYWRPLSWLSHMLDVELFGAVAPGHHLSSLLIHCAAVVMCLLALHRITGELWPSAFVAALFAWHPLHVESVAWIAERKDVLCGFFWFLTIWAYARYVDEPTPKRYLLTFASFVLAVMSKPMVVTLPCVLLLLDIWPLRRISPPSPAEWRLETLRELARAWWPLWKEKLPLFGVVAVLCFSTVYSQHRVGAMSSFDGLPWSVRIPCVFYAYGMYLTQTFIPTNLCVLYPHLGVDVRLQDWLAAAVFMLVASGICLAWIRRLPVLFVGWFWFVGVLVPVIGLIQVGEQAHADRYTYLPLTGLLMALVWPVLRIAELARVRSHWRFATAALILAICALLTRRQLPYWESSVTVMKRATDVTENNATAMNNYGSGLISDNKLREATYVLSKAYLTHRTQAPLFNLSYIFFLQKDAKRAIDYFHEAVRMDPRSRFSDEQVRVLTLEAEKDPTDPTVRRLLALLLGFRGDHNGAIKLLQEAERSAPSSSEIKIDLAAHLAKIGAEAEAMALLSKVVEASPTNLVARSNLGGLLAKQGKLSEAMAHLEAAVKSDPKNPDSRHNWALVLAKLGRDKEAVEAFGEVLKQSPHHRPAGQQLAWLLATRPSVRDGARSVRIAQRLVETAPKPSADLLDLLAAAHAANNQFQQAKECIADAVIVAERERNQKLLESIRERQRIYLRNEPYSENAALRSGG